jgi:hypothetical protein
MKHGQICGRWRFRRHFRRHFVLKNAAISPALYVSRGGRFWTTAFPTQERFVIREYRIEQPVLVS